MTLQNDHWSHQVDTLCEGELSRGESLAKHTSWRVGGAAEYCFHPKHADDLVTFLKCVPAFEKITWLGLGSNTLVRDGGLAGVVILTQGRLKAITQLDDFSIRAEAGVACAQLARFSARQGLTGIEFLAGIPGTVGGALAMNAGCFEGETWDALSAVETVNREGVYQTKDPSMFEVAYRSVKLPPDEWFVAGHFRLSPGDKEQSLEQIRTLLDRRSATQPTGDPSCGSVFRNPSDDYAARLIESCKLKGFSLGGAAVSEKHANFIVNTGSATAKDIESLIDLVAKRVLEDSGIKLTKEVRIVGSDNVERN